MKKQIVLFTIASFLVLFSLISIVGADYEYYTQDCNACPTDCTAPGVDQCAKQVTFRSNTGFAVYFSSGGAHYHKGKCSTTSDCRTHSNTAICDFVKFFTSSNSSLGKGCFDQQCKTCKCSNQCSSKGLKKCSSGRSYQECGNYDHDSCLEWSAPIACGRHKSCNAGKCD